MTERKINLLIAVAGLGIGGAEVVIRNLVHSIDRGLFNVTICCIKTAGPIGEELARNGFDVVVLAPPGQTKVDYLTFLKMCRLIRERRIDVVHSHTTDALADAAVCRLLRPGLRLVHTFHFGNYPNLHGRERLIEGVFARVANRLVAVSEAQRQQIKATYRYLSDSSLDKVWNGVPLSGATPDGSFRTALGITNEVLIGTVATLIKQKGLDDLLAVAKRLKDSGRSARFVIVGEGHLRAELEAKRLELGVQDSVVLAGWIADASQKVVPEFDIFFQPSRWEAMSIALLEAMGAGLPVVATSVGENPYIVDHEIDGLLVQPGDVSGMAAALERMVDSQADRRQLGSAAKAKVSRLFSVDQMTKAYERIYLDLVYVRGTPGHPGARPVAP